jgi:hypothetical protein
MSKGFCRINDHRDTSGLNFLAMKKLSVPQYRKARRSGPEGFDVGNQLIFNGFVFESGRGVVCVEPR